MSAITPSFTGSASLGLLKPTRTILKWLRSLLEPT